MRNRLLKILKSLLQSTSARHHQRVPVGLYKKNIKHAKLAMPWWTISP